MIREAYTATERPGISREQLAVRMGQPAEVPLEGAVADLVDEALELLAGSANWGRGILTLRLQAHSEGGDSGSAPLDSIRLEDGSVWTSPKLAAGFRDLRVDRVLIAVFSAGPQLDERMRRLWLEGRPDLAVAVHTAAGLAIETIRSALLSPELPHPESPRLESPRPESPRSGTPRSGSPRSDASHVEILRGGKAETMRVGRVILPHYSPGYAGWDLVDQGTILVSLAAQDAAGPVEVLPSGGLIPSYTTVAVWGIASSDVTIPDGFWSRPSGSDAESPGEMYSISERILRKWREHRLRVENRGKGRCLTTFRFDGSTCGGVPLSYDYSLELHRESDGGYRVLASSVRPSKSAPGYRSMCAYQEPTSRGPLEYDSSAPWIHERLEAAIRLVRDGDSMACLCTRGSRDHKWNIVLQANHYALTHDEI